MYLDSKYQNTKIQYDVIPCDRLQKTLIISYPFCYVVNNEPSGQPGEHWVAIFIEGPDRPMEFFCSFGRSIHTYPKYFNDFAVRNNLSVNESIIDLQSLDSSVCGQHAIFFLYSRASGTSFSSFYVRYRRHTPCENDKHVAEFVHRIMTKPSCLKNMRPVCKNVKRLR